MKVTAARLDLPSKQNLKPKQVITEQLSEAQPFQFPIITFQTTLLWMLMPGINMQMVGKWHQWILYFICYTPATLS